MFSPFTVDKLDSISFLKEVYSETVLNRGLQQMEIASLSLIERSVYVYQ